MKTHPSSNALQPSTALHASWTLHHDLCAQTAKLHKHVESAVWAIYADSCHISVLDIKDWVGC